MTKKYYDTDKMAEIIQTLIQKFGNDRLIVFLLDRLIRLESDHLSFQHKSAGVLKLEEQNNVSIAGLSRYDIRAKKIKNLIIEHGLPESQAIKMCCNAKSKDEVKAILEEVKNNLVCITKDEDKKIGKGERRKGPSGFYWEETYKKSGIDVIENRGRG